MGGSLTTDIVSEVTFSLKIPNFSQRNTPITSSSHNVRNLLWQVNVVPNVDSNRQNNKTLGLFVKCNGNGISSLWSCNATVEFRLKSYKSGQSPFIKQARYLFSSTDNRNGFSDFMSWEEITNSENGYIQNDTIHVEVQLFADIPQVDN